MVDFFETEKFTDEEVLYSALWKDKRIDEKYHWPESGESGVNHGSNDFDITSYNQNPYNHVYCEIVTETIFDNSATQISDKPLKDISHLINEPQKFALIKLDKIRGNACVSRK